MDELFLLPPSPIAMPRAYWLTDELSDQIMVVTPSHHNFQRLLSVIENHSPNKFDMDIVNDLYKSHCIIIPHRPYNILTGEFRHNDHRPYFGEDEIWNGTSALEEAKFVHFSDAPYPKPWIEASDGQAIGIMPDCQKTGRVWEEDCTDRELWFGLYKDFRRRRRVSL